MFARGVVRDTIIYSDQRLGATYCNLPKFSPVVGIKLTLLYQHKTVTLRTSLICSIAMVNILGGAAKLSQGDT
jgi:hypothetical protein